MVARTDGVELPTAIVEAHGLVARAAGRLGAGHVHDSYLSRRTDGTRVVLQRLNASVFGDLEAVMANASRAAGLVAAAGGSTVEFLADVDGSMLTDDGRGGRWRAHRYIEGRVEATPRGPSDVRAVAVAFGAFDAALTGSDPTTWHVTIDGFHDRHARRTQLESAVGRDVASRVSSVGPEIEAARDLAERLEGLEELHAWDAAPLRVAHHDAKAVNIVLGHPRTATVLDLDTVMPGTVLSDVGELVRSCGRAVDEDGPGRVDETRVIAAIDGFVDGWGLPLHDAERVGLPGAGPATTVLNALRFLSDHLDGDAYFHVDHPDHNLERARAMLAAARDQIAMIDRIRRGLAT